MKNLSLISFVGVDAHTKLDDLYSFHDSLVQCEFGVLYSESRRNTRYPDYDFCDNFLQWGMAARLKTSLHLCGDDAINKFLTEDAQIIKLCKAAGRIQLNIKIQSFPDHEVLADNILNVSFVHGLTIILQKNATKAKFNEVILGKISDRIRSIHLLNDSSGGFGREITTVQEPHKTCFTGYAGGINPDNVSRIVNLIENTNTNNLPYYIDMESGIRTDNILSLDKCKEIIKNLNA